jgi:hypothetical protein
MRRYLPTLAELVDRMSIVALKALFIPESAQEYRDELKLIENDLDWEFRGRKNFLTAEFIRAVMVIVLSNREIWLNEARVRAGTGNGDLRLTHSLNGIRNRAKNLLARIFDERQDRKVDCLAAQEVAGWDALLRGDTDLGGRDVGAGTDFDIPGPS